MIRKLSLVVALAGAVAVLGVPGVASADGTGQFCTSGDPCVSMNGTTGNLVYGKSPTPDNQQDTAVTGYLVCTHGGQPSEYVQSKTRTGDTTNCPFADHTLDQDLVGDEIVLIDNIPFSQFIRATQGNFPHLAQAANGQSGEEFIKGPGGAYVNVAMSDYYFTQEYLCPGDFDGPLVLSSDQGGCNWSFF